MAKILPYPAQKRGRPIITGQNQLRTKSESGLISGFSTRITVGSGEMSGLSAKIMAVIREMIAVIREMMTVIREIMPFIL
jgi:hypothetical protein